MKEFFKGYYKLTEREIEEIWSSGFICLDTNVLFNIYRYSEETRRELLKVIKKYSSKLWLTNHSAFEFQKNRIAVITKQMEIYDETIKTLNTLQNDILKNIKSPHLSKPVHQKFEKTLKETIKDLEKKKEFYKKLLNNDTILSKISTIFHKKIGNSLTNEELSEIEKDGEVRYKKSIPPGYKDKDKKENKFGDLIIWKELIKKSKEDKKSFIFIVDDLKEDWWLRVKGQTISPRQELSQELFKECGQCFHLYTSDRFLEFESKTDKVKQNTIDEVREVSANVAQEFIHTDFENHPFLYKGIAELNDFNLPNLMETMEQINRLSPMFESNRRLQRILKARNNSAETNSNNNNNEFSDEINE
jgi:septum formation topological specificity factor MinE